MAISKRSGYSGHTLHLSDIAKAIGHPARFSIVKYLQQNEYGTNTIFQDLTNLRRATITQHLKELDRVKLIYSDYDYGGKTFLAKEAAQLLQELSYGLLEN